MSREIQNKFAKRFAIVAALREFLHSLTAFFLLLFGFYLLDFILFRMDTVWWLLEESTPYGVLLMNNLLFTLLRKICFLVVKERFARTRIVLAEFLATWELCADVAELGK